MSFKPYNNVFNNWDKDLYISRKNGVSHDDYNNEIVTYNVPSYFGKVNYQPLTGKTLDSYIKEFGETKNKLVVCFIDYVYEDKMSEFDKVYLYGATPNGEKINGNNANYIVRTFRPQNTKIMVIFEEIIK